MCGSQKLIYEEVVRLGPERLCEWLTRSRSDLANFSAPLVQRGALLLFPALAGAYHDGFRSLNVLSHYVNLAFLQDIAQGKYPERVKRTADTALHLVNEVVGAVPSVEAHKHYDDAMFMYLIRLRAIGMLSSLYLDGVRDCSVNLAPYVKEILATENLAPPSFPVLIWAGNLPKLND